jgi:deoxyribose-phosphate aldolase
MSDSEDVPSRIEHTVLGPETTPDDVIEVLDAAIELGMRACIPPCYLDLATNYAPTVDLATVIGFPHGQHATGTKCHEAKEAWEAGADELDVVLNVGRLRAGEDDTVREDIEEVVAAVPVPVKVIIETPLLQSEDEKRRACEAVVDADADFLKTATGFSDGGATVEDVELMSEYLPVKASGGVGSWEQAKAMFDAGAERIGASSGDTIVREYQAAQGDGDPAGTDEESVESDTEEQADLDDPWDDGY